MIVKSIFASMRPPFLLLTGSVMVLMLAYVEYQAIPWSYHLFLLILIGAIAAHISVNMLNEYDDYHSGLDFLTSKTPFSGGSGALTEHAQAAEWVGQVGYLFLGMVVSIGAFFIFLRGWAILPIGLVGILIIVSYTTFLTRYPLLCLMVSGLAFGPLMMNGGYFVLTGQFSLTLFVLSLIPFFLVNNLLLLNQVPDMEADRQVGRFNLLHKYGVSASMNLFILHWVLAFVVLGGLIAFGDLPVSASMGFLALFLSLPVVLKVKYLSATEKNALNPIMGLNVALTLLMPLFIAGGLYYASP